MRKIGFSPNEEICNLDKTKNRTNTKNELKEPQLKVQRLGTEWVEFYLEPPIL